MPGPTLPSDQPPEQGPEETPPVTGEVPEDILSLIIADAVERTGAEPAEIEIVSTQSITWGDTSLGCPKPGKVYAQVLVNGYWVVLRYQEQEFDYRVDNQFNIGNFFLCTEGSPWYSET
jgi:hypothetical protein